MLISASDETEFLKPLLLLDAADRVHVYPDTAASRRRLADAAAGASLFLYTADRRTCVMRGLAIRSTQQVTSRLSVFLFRFYLALLDLSILNWFHLVLPCFTYWYWALLIFFSGFSLFYWVLPSFPGIYPVLPGFT